jgi:hypothetical protein
MLIGEVVVASVSAYAAFLSNPAQNAPLAVGNLEARVQKLEQVNVALETAVKKVSEIEVKQLVLKPTNRWQLVRVDDCPGLDDREIGATKGEEPVSANCKRKDLTAVCWDGTLYQNGGGAWCTYKNVIPSACSGGSRPGRLYRCDPS